MTEALYIETSEKEDRLKKCEERRLNVSGVLKILGVSRSGYNAWKKRLPSNHQHRKEEFKNRIKEIYDESKQIYGAPKIASILNENNEHISAKTVGNYMREMGIKAVWIKPYTVTTINSDFNNKLKNILHQEFNPDEPNAFWCQI